MLKRCLGIVALCAAMTGCSVVMAAKQPQKKDLTVMSVGTPRSLVLAELGAPVSTETKDGKRTDIFSFTQGYSSGAKAGRVVGHLAADVLTLGLWEVAGTPTEASFNGNREAYEVRYDPSDRVEAVVQLKK